MIENTLRFLTEEYENGTLDQLMIHHDLDFGFLVTNWTKFRLYENTQFGGTKAVQTKLAFIKLIPWMNNLFPRPVKD